MSQILRCREVIGEIHLSSIVETYPKRRDGGVVEPEPVPYGSRVLRRIYYTTFNIYSGI